MRSVTELLLFTLAGLVPFLILGRVFPESSSWERFLPGELDRGGAEVSLCILRTPLSLAGEKEEKGLTDQILKFSSLFCVVS